MNASNSFVRANHTVAHKEALKVNSIRFTFLIQFGFSGGIYISRSRIRSLFVQRDLQSASAGHVPAPNSV